MSGRLQRAIFVGVIATLAAAAVQLLVSGQWRSVAWTLGLAALVVGGPLLVMRGISAALALRRAAHWQAVEGRHHSFAGQSLDIVDDGRHVWLAAADLQRVLRSKDKDDVIAARHAGRWRRNPRGQLQLRVDAVVQVLATAPGRMDPHIIHLRRYLEREVLFPATKRAQIAAGDR